MEAKEKAQELIEKYKPYVYCYAGSGMLTNDYNEEVATMCAKQCALVAVEEVISEIKESLEVATHLHPHTAGLLNGSLLYWNSVLKELNN